MTDTDPGTLHGILHGSCACGASRFECDAPPRFVCHCHCGNCRKAHGAAFVTWAGFRDEQFRWTSESAQLGRWLTDTGATRTFCTVCGTTMLYASPRWPGEVHVAVAVLDDAEDLVPKLHVYADRAPRWCPITDALPRYGGPTGTEPLVPPSA
ncbi:MAG: GFA family protein [Planctomycetes bacterium]|nr:GFA family protein [Planctomycetota bacterium]